MSLVEKCDKRPPKKKTILISTVRQRPFLLFSVFDIFLTFIIINLRLSSVPTTTYLVVGPSNRPQRFDTFSTNIFQPTEEPPPPNPSRDFFLPAAAAIETRTPNSNYNIIMYYLS